MVEEKTNLRRSVLRPVFRSGFLIYRPLMRAVSLSFNPSFVTYNSPEFSLVVSLSLYLSRSTALLFLVRLLFPYCPSVFLLMVVFCDFSH